MIELEDKHIEDVSGGAWAHVATAVALVEAAYEFYEGFTDHRK